MAGEIGALNSNVRAALYDRYSAARRIGKLLHLAGHLCGNFLDSVARECLVISEAQDGSKTV